MKKFILGLVAASAVAVVAPGLASAAPSDNPTPRDAQGFAITNHIHNGHNGEYHGIGHLRSEMTGEQISAQSGNRVPEYNQGDYPSISNNG